MKAAPTQAEDPIEVHHVVRAGGLRDQELHDKGNRRDGRASARPILAQAAGGASGSLPGAASGAALVAPESPAVPVST